jgi:small subunit ribosomal protein S1
MTDQVRREEVAEGELLDKLLDAADAPAAEAAAPTPEGTAEAAAEPTPETVGEAAADPVVADTSPVAEVSAVAAAPAEGETIGAEGTETAEAETAETPVAAEAAEAGAPDESTAVETAEAGAPVVAEAAEAVEAGAPGESTAVETAEAGTPVTAEAAEQTSGEGASFTPVAEESGRPRRLKDLEPGMDLEGRVTSIALYGVFVDVGVGRDGLVHISEMSDTRIDTPSDLVQIGDVVKVRVKSLDPEARRISLTMRSQERSEGGRGRSRGKRPEIDREAIANIKVGDVLEGTITGYAPFGAFADIGVGKDGLIHVSELAESRVEKPEDAVKVGEKHLFKVLEVDPDGTRISLSLRKAMRSQKLQQLETGQMMEGVVSGLAPFGAFVDIGVGRDGLVHISALSSTRVAKVEDVVKVGDKVTVRVLGVDQHTKKISLTMRLEDDGEAEEEDYEVSGTPAPRSGVTDTARFAAAAQAQRERRERDRDRRERRNSPQPVMETFATEDYEEEFKGDATLEDLLSKFGGPSSNRRDRRRERGEDDDNDDHEIDEREDRRQRDAIRRTLQQVGRDD